MPKSFLPNYREYYEKRWFVSGIGLNGIDIAVAGETVPFGTDLIFAAEDLDDFIFHVEICEDYWAPQPPSTFGALAGALILCNLSASNITIGKADERKLLCASQSSRCCAAYVYAASGPGESTTDLAWDGQGSIYEMGELLCESRRFDPEPELCVADIDVQRLRLERMRMPTFNDNAVAAGHPEKSARRIHFDHEPSLADIGFERRYRRFPYVPNRPEQLDSRIATRRSTSRSRDSPGVSRRRAVSHLVIGVSGGLDSTHALIVAAKTCDFLEAAALDHSRLHHAGLRHRRGHQRQCLGADEGARHHRRGDRYHARRRCRCSRIWAIPSPAGEPVYDITFENVQAGLRTDYLFRLANQRGRLRRRHRRPLGGGPGLVRPMASATI